MNLLKSHKTFNGLTQYWEHPSTATRSNMRLSSFVPEGPLKGCLIWLSGLTCTEENFITKAGAQRFLAEHQLMVVCPDTSPRGLNLPGDKDTSDFGEGAGFYVDATTPSYREHFRMYSYVSDELLGLIRSHFKWEGGVSIFGHSMGGHGALVLALREPEKFKSVSAFAPVSHPTQSPWGQKAFLGYLGESRDVWNAYDACELIRAGKRFPHPILIDQGTLDPFLKERLHTSHLVELAESVMQPMTVKWREGYDHSYFYISSFIEEHIAFHRSYLA